MGSAAASLSRSVLGPGHQVARDAGKGCKGQQEETNCVPEQPQALVPADAQMRIAVAAAPPLQRHSRGRRRSHLRMAPNTAAWGKNRRKKDMAMAL